MPKDFILCSRFGGSFFVRKEVFEFQSGVIYTQMSLFV